MEAREVARRDQTQTVRTKAWPSVTASRLGSKVLPSTLRVLLKATEAVRAAEREMQAARKRAEQAEARRASSLILSCSRPL